MMKHLLLLLVGPCFLLGCSESNKPGVDPVLTPQTANGEWVVAQNGAGGFVNYESFKNYQYTVEVSGNNQPVSIRLTSSDINVGYALFNTLGQRIDASSTGRDVTKPTPYTLNAGIYRVVVMAERLAVGKFTLTMLGVKAEPARIPSERFASSTQNWGTLGGGGSTKTFKNHFYTFEATEDNFSADIELQSADTDVEMVVYDPLGQAIASDFFNSRYRFKILALKKGTYTIMAATDKRGNVGNYQLSVVGKVTNLKRVESQVNTVTGRWADRNATDTYSIQLMPNSSPLDIELVSPDTPALISLQTNVGTVIVAGATDSKNEFIVRQDMAKNTYRIQVYPPRLNRGGPGNYTLHVHGQFTDFKKI